MNIHMSPEASRKICDMMTSENVTNAWLRIRVQTGGCSGFTYALELSYEINETDQTQMIEGVPVVVDSDSVKYVNGLLLDYKETELGGGFVIENPNAIATCGCGSSFRTREEAGVPSDC